MGLAENLEAIDGSRVSNGSGIPASGPGLDRKNGLVRLQTQPKT